MSYKTAILGTVADLTILLPPSIASTTEVEEIGRGPASSAVEAATTNPETESRDYTACNARGFRTIKSPTTGATGQAYVPRNASGYSCYLMQSTNYTNAANALQYGLNNGEGKSPVIDGYYGGAT